MNSARAPLCVCSPARMENDGFSGGTDEDLLPGSDITVVRADGRHRLCHLELDGRLIEPLSRRGLGSRVGINVEAGLHTVCAVSGRSASAALTLDLTAEERVTATIGRHPDCRVLWTLVARPTSDRRSGEAPGPR